MNINPFRRGTSTALNTPAVFAGIGAGPAAAAADDDTDMNKTKKGKKAPKDTPEEEPDASTQEPATSAERDPDDEDDDCDCEGDDDSDEADMQKSKKGKKGKQAAVFAARSRERSRIAAIFAHPGADAKVDMAAHLAFNTSMGRQAACDFLDRTPAQAKAGLSAAMAEHAGKTPGPNPPEQTSSTAAVDARWDAAFARVKKSARSGR